MRLQLKSIIQRSNQFYYADKIRHPYIYSDGCIDVDAIQRKKRRINSKICSRVFGIP